MIKLTDGDIRKHLGLVALVTKKYKYSQLPRDEIHSIALRSLLKAYNGFNPTKGGFATYAIKIMTMDVIEAFRKLNKDNKGMIDNRGDYTHDDILEQAAQHTPNLDDEIDTDRFLNSLSGRTKDMMIMHYIGGYELQEIGDKYNLTASRVQQILSRAVSDLKGLL